MNTSVTDFTDVLTNKLVAPFITNGVLVVPETAMMLMVKSIKVVGQLLADVAAPIEIVLTSTINTIEPDGSLSEVTSIRTTGAPGQAYHLAVCEFADIVYKKAVDSI